LLFHRTERRDPASEGRSPPGARRLGRQATRCPARHPTLKELGYKDVEFYIWSGFFAPRATPPAAIKVLREATRKAVNTPEFKTALEKMETPITYLDADDFQKFWDTDAKRLIQGVRNIGKVQ